MIHETLEISGSHNITGSLLLPLLTEETTLAPGGLAHLDGKTYICNGTNWLQLAETLQAAASVEYLVVAGGGGSGGGGQTGYHGGGGGGGGLLSGSIPSTTATFTVTIGAGGSAGAQSGDAGYSGTNGQDSSISGTSITTITSVGGGAGAGNSTSSPASRQGNDGGSGGGGALYSGVGGSGTNGQGNDGGNASANYQGAGGGGGAGTAGGNSVSTGGSGGEGKYNFTTGTATYYGGGGAGRGQSGNGAAVNGATAVNTAGAANKGAGGGGRQSTSGMAGGSGVAIFAYDSGSLSCGGGYVGDAGDGKKYHQFNTTGTFKVGATSDFNIVTDNLEMHLDAADFGSRGTSTWTDLSGNGRNGITIQGTSLDNYHYQLDGINDYIRVNQFDFTSTHTIEWWFNADNLTQKAAGGYAGHMFCWGYSPSIRIYLKTNGDIDGYLAGSSTFNAKLGGGVQAATWHHIVLTSDYVNNESKLYLDGSLNQTTDISAAGNWSYTGSSNFYDYIDFGKNVSNNNLFYDGKVSQIRVYSKLLSSSEVLQNYNATKTNFT